MSSNHPSFEDIVEKLETGEIEEVIEVLELSEDEERESFINAGDMRDDSIPEYGYRYRPIKRRGFTLLHYAMIYGTPEVVQHLLDWDADPMANSDPKNRHQHNVIHIPCYLGKIETLKALLYSSKIEQERKEKLVNDPYTHINESGIASRWKWTPIHYACGENNQDVLKLLLKFKADPFMYGGFGYACKVSNSEIVEILLRKFKDIISQYINQNEGVGTPLQQGGKKSCCKIVELLISNGADPTVEDRYKKNSLHYAIMRGNEACVLKMLQAKQVTKSVIQKFFTEKIALKCIDNNLPLVLSKLLQLSHQAQRTGKIIECLLHKVILRNVFTLEVFSQIVKFSGKDCIEEEDDEGKTPMLLAASLNLHKELHILFTTYLEILEENFFFYKKDEYKSLYTDTVAKMDSKGLCIAHLAVECIGSDSDFEDTVRVVNDMWNKLKDLNRNRTEIQDPFLMVAKDGELGRNVSPVQLACKIGQPERILPIIEVTEARSLFHCDEDIIHWALNYDMQIVDFEKLCSLIVMSLQKKRKILKKVFNLEAGDASPLHLAMKRKQFAHVKIMLRLKLKDGQEIVDFKSVGTFTLHVALVHSAPREIMQMLLERIKSDGWKHFPLLIRTDSKPQIDLPVIDAKATAINHVLNEASNLFTLDRHPIITSDLSCSLEKLLNDAVEHGRMDIFEMVTVKHSVVFSSTLRLIIQIGRNEEFVMIAVRHSCLTELLKVLTSVIHGTSAGDEDTTFFNELIKKMPGVAMEALNRSLDTGKKKEWTLLQHPKELEDYPQYSRRNGGEEKGVLLPSNGTSKSSKNVTHPLDLMVETRQKKLLKHPLVTDYLNSQWLAGAFWMYCIQIFLYLCFIGFFSSLVLNLRHPSDSTCNSSMKKNSSNENVKDNRIIFGLSILSVLFATFQGIFPIVNTILYIKRKYPLKGVEVKSFILSAPEIWLQIPTATFTLFFVGKSIEVSICNTCHGNESWTFGVFAIILAWTNLTLILYKFPVIGHYALVFAAICWTFFQLMFFAIFLLLASTVVLRMIFYNPLAPYSPFSNFGDGVAMVTSMITGDYGYQDIFGLSFSPEFTRDYELYDRNMANFIWILFIVLIPILLSNMLTSLAVGDTNEIQQNADIRKLELKVKWVTGNQKCWVPKCCIEMSTNISNLFISETEAKAERNSINEYHKKLKNDKKVIENKYSAIPGGSDAEVLETVQEVTKSNQRKLREIKIIHDKALNRLQKGQAQLKRQLESHQP